MKLIGLTKLALLHSSLQIFIYLFLTFKAKTHQENSDFCAFFLHQNSRVSEILYHYQLQSLHAQLKANQMAQLIEIFVSESWRPDFNHQNLGLKGGKNWFLKLSSYFLVGCMWKMHPVFYLTNHIYTPNIIANFKSWVEKIK